ncbi:MAG: 5-formyltetrahydrofolate cyclo-ligase [Rhizobiaceae bacterium]|nr:5-formyltetrahydrofolate cyclo-ligase [Rhizobiaceae bacterium]
MSDNRRLKKALRRQALARRDALDPQWRIEASLIAADSAARIEVDPGDVVSGFWPIRSEIDPRPALSALAERGARLCLPAILDHETIVFRELVRGAPLVDMGFGTAGPGLEAAILQPTIMLIPLAAFDRRGHRIGYGAGYYDRAIAAIIDRGGMPRLIGMAFDCQMVETVPDEPHDVILPEILTETGLHRLGIASRPAGAGESGLLGGPSPD